MRVRVRPTKAKGTDPLRVRSKLLFGNADRLQVAHAIARWASELVSAQELSDALGITSPRVRAQLLAFAEAGLMEALPRTSLTQYYKRCDDPFWEAVARIVDSWG